jgi:DNA-directed RNA polymerase subunit E'/Rpb7
VGYDVTLIGRLLNSSIKLKKQTYNQKRLNSWFQKGKIMYLEFNIRLFFVLLFTSADCICAIDLDTILPCYFSSKIRNIKRVYDAHELFTEQKEIVTRPAIQKLWLRVERFAVPKFLFGYTVNDFIAKEFIGAVIGPQGKVIQEIQRETGTTINLEEVGSVGEVSIFSPVKEGLDKAVAWIKGIVAVPQVGDVYEATVKGIKEFGAFVEFMPGKQGLLHISEISWKRLESMEGVLKENDIVKVKLIGLDPKTGKFKLSRKVLMPKPEFKPREQQQ